MPPPLLQMRYELAETETIAPRLISTTLETGIVTITLITGASRGLGYEAARRLTAPGHTVLAGARDPQRGAKAAHELGATFIGICDQRLRPDPATGRPDRHLPGPARHRSLVEGGDHAGEYLVPVSSCTRTVPAVADPRQRRDFPDTAAF